MRSLFSSMQMLGTWALVRDSEIDMCGYLQGRKTKKKIKAWSTFIRMIAYALRRNVLCEHFYWDVPLSENSWQDQEEAVSLFGLQVFLNSPALRELFDLQKSSNSLRYPWFRNALEPLSILLWDNIFEIWDISKHVLVKKIIIIINKFFL